MDSFKIFKLETVYFTKQVKFLENMLKYIDFFEFV